MFTNSVPKALVVHTETATSIKDVRSNGDLLDYAKQAESALNQCNADKDAIAKLK